MGDRVPRPRQGAPKACDAISCNSGEHCLGQKMYGYDCRTCVFVAGGGGDVSAPAPPRRGILSRRKQSTMRGRGDEADGARGLGLECQRRAVAWMDGRSEAPAQRNGPPLALCSGCRAKTHIAQNLPT